MGGSIVKYSRLLQKGDTIGICTPFTGASGDVLSTRLNNVISNIQALDYKVIETASVRHGIKCVSDNSLIDAMKQGLGNLEVPVIYDADIGYIPSQIQIVNGAIGEVEFADGKATIRQSLRNKPEDNK